MNIRKSHRLAVLLVLVAALICGGSLSAFAAEIPSDTAAPATAGTASATPTVEIYACNVSFMGNVYPKYAVRTENAEGAQLQLLIWNAPLASDADYTPETADSVLQPSGTTRIDGMTMTVFTYKDLAAKQLTDDIYARAMMTLNGEVYYSQLLKYSILQYAYNMFGYTGSGTQNQALKDMLHAMLEYGAAAQKYFNYKTDSLATAIYSQVTVYGGELSDHSSRGLFLPGTELTLSATVPEGSRFVRWTDGDGNTVSENESFQITVPEPGSDENGNPIIAVCNYTAVYEELERFSTGLTYRLNSAGSGYAVTGIGSCTDTALNIPEQYCDLPVTEIAEDAFRGCTQIASVTLPSCIIRIGASAFEGCSALVSINLPESLTSIGDKAFYLCINIVVI
ncbi:MAG: leucine-rich repeat protein, partial [Roseburia sp.]|nr:leucine-rich repeat protein [Roseburia sp.]